MTKRTGKKQKVSGVNASSVIDQDVLLTDITLPAFLSSQCIPGPIPAVVMDMDAQYDLIIGMDVTQVIGLVLHNLSKKHVPFKSHDYFDDAPMHESLGNTMDQCPIDSINDFSQWKFLISHQSFEVLYTNKWMYTMLLHSKNIYWALSNLTLNRY
jgi:hypothetical protein